jgi:hypothetical protein
MLHLVIIGTLAWLAVNIACGCWLSFYRIGGK